MSYHVVTFNLEKQDRDEILGPNPSPYQQPHGGRLSVFGMALMAMSYAEAVECAANFNRDVLRGVNHDFIWAVVVESDIQPRNGDDVCFPPLARIDHGWRDENSAATSGSQREAVAA